MGTALEGVYVDERIKLLMELTGRINSNIELDSLLLDIIKAAKELTASEASSLFLLDEKNDELVLSIPTGPATEKISGERMPKDKGIAGWIVMNQKPVIVNDVKEDSRFGGDFNPSLFKTRNLMGVPLMSREEKIVGVLEAVNKKDEMDFSEEDLSIFQGLANQAAIAIERAQLYEEHQEKELMEQKLELAHSIQSGFWPDQPPVIEGYDIAGTSRPAENVGGDYYDFVQLNGSENYGFTVADVTGKGVPAAILMASARSALRTQVENSHTIEELITMVNRSIFKDTPIDKFITLVYGELDIEEDIFKYVNAGHTESFLIDYNNNEITSLTEGGIMLGIQEDVQYDCQAIKLKSGQRIIMYSDGITEACNDHGEMYGKERFKKWLLNHPNTSASETIVLLLREIGRFSPSEKQDDDITVVVIQKD